MPNRSRLNQLPPIGSLLRFNSSDSYQPLSSPTSLSSPSPSSFSDKMTTICQEDSECLLEAQSSYFESIDYINSTPPTSTTINRFTPYFILSSPTSLAHANANNVLNKIANRMKNCGKTRVKTWKKYSKKKGLTQDEMDKKRDLANQQERTRMHRLNSALKNLRNAIPYEFSKHPPEKNLSKIKTLRIAIEYIRQLSKMLDENV